MTTSLEKESNLKGSPVAYLAFLPRLVNIAKEMGYALAVHGTLARDFDLIAVAWTHDAVQPEVLVEAFIKATGGYIICDPNADPFDYTRRCPEPKPHGRLAWSIYLSFDKFPGHGPYIDLSVIPPIQDSVVKHMEILDQFAKDAKSKMQ